MSTWLYTRMARVVAEHLVFIQTCSVGDQSNHSRAASSHVGPTYLDTRIIIVAEVEDEI